MYELKLKVPSFDSGKNAYHEVILLPTNKHYTKKNLVVTAANLGLQKLFDQRCNDLKLYQDLTGYSQRTTFHKLMALREGQPLKR